MKRFSSKNATVRAIVTFPAHRGSIRGCSPVINTRWPGAQVCYFPCPLIVQVSGMDFHSTRERNRPINFDGRGTASALTYFWRVRFSIRHPSPSDPSPTLLNMHEDAADTQRVHAAGPLHKIPPSTFFHRISFDPMNFASRFRRSTSARNVIVPGPLLLVWNADFLKAAERTCYELRLRELQIFFSPARWNFGREEGWKWMVRNFKGTSRILRYKGGFFFLPPRVYF